MAWPKPRNRRSPVPVETSGNGNGGTPEGARPHAVTPEAGGRPSWPSVERWPSAHATVAPVPAETEPSAEEASEDSETDPGDRPFWENWGRADLDEPDDGFGEDGPADDAVTDVDPRPRRSWDSVVSTAGVTREQPKAEGIGQHLGSVAHLSANPRRRTWQWRVLVAAVVGLVAGFLLHDWRLADLRRAGRDRRHRHPVADGVQG